MINPRVEEFLEDLFLRQEEDPQHEMQSVDESAVREAVDEGLIRLDAGSPRLTEDGLVAGRNVVRRHRLAECLLHDVLQVKPEHTHSDACRFEHILQHGLDDRICTLLGHPLLCPDGRPIPRGECCHAAERNGLNEVGPLCDGRAGQEGVVAYLSTRDNREIQKLMAMGILPGTAIRLVRLFPSYIFEVGYSQFAVDRSLAEKIIVHWRV